ncbi:MAG: ABC transporter permease [Desulfobacteraceae bacterium]
MENSYRAEHGPNLFWWGAGLLSVPLVLLIVMPLGNMLSQPEIVDLVAALKDEAVQDALARSISTSLMATSVAAVFATPLAYMLARKNFKGKKIIEGLVDLPIMIPHPVIGIAILSLMGRNCWLGRLLYEMGIEVMGSITGIVIVLTFVGAPFYINSVKAGFEAVPERLEKASRGLGASMSATFFRISLPLVWRNMVLGAVMCTARAISEFGAVVIVAYHPMTAPVLIYERFTAYGLRYAQAVAFWLIIISLFLFLLMRMFSRQKGVV